MATTTPQSSSSPADVHGGAGFYATADHQVDSVLFGKLPAEIREMIYEECWVASGLRQHVFRHDESGRLAHYPCSHNGQLLDERNQEFEPVWRATTRRRSRGSQSGALALADDKWAARLSSPWRDHWRCYEKMVENAAGEDSRRKNKKNKTLFLPMLLSCKRTYLEAYRHLYSSLTFIFTDLEAATMCLQRSPSLLSPMPTHLLSSLSFSLSESFHTLHQHHHHRTQGGVPGPWTDLCTTLSDMVRFDSLNQVTIRLDLADDDKCWWNVRERWILAPVRGMLARRLKVQLPERTFDPDWLRPYQYSSDQDQAENDSDGGEKPLFRLERYPRVRWRAGKQGGVVVPRHEFIRPVDQRLAEAEAAEPDEDAGTKRDRARRSLMDFKDTLKLRRGSAGY